MEDGYFVAGYIQGKSLAFLVDTGSCCTILSRNVLDRWPQETRPSLTPVNLHLVTATGESSPFLGKAEIEITLGSQKLLHDVLFADVKNDGILGMDFLTRHRCDVFLSKDHLILNGEKIACFRSSVDIIPTCCRIAILESVEVPPESEIIVQGRPLDRVDTNSIGILEATESFVDRSGLLIAKALVCPEFGTVPMRIMNLTSQSFMLNKNTVAAIYEPVETEKFEIVNSLSTDPTANEQPSPHIDELLLQSSSNLNEFQKESLRSLLYDYKDQFSKSSHDLGCTNLVEHTINTLPDCKPVKLRPYRIPLAKREFAENEIKAMAEKGLIEPSHSAWSAPAVLVPKRDGTTRFCIDYRRLNQLTVPDSHPLPRIDDTLDALGGSCWFSTLDLKSGFHQVSIREEDRPKTAFSIPGSGLWQWRVLPFGLINSPSVFERLMERVFAGLTFLILLIYLDDIIVYSKTFEEHLENLRVVLERLKKSNLKLNPKKCNLLCNKVAFLGHEVSEQGISTDPAKIEAVKDWPQPNTATEVRQFVGLASYYRKFIPNFATVCKPLHKLTEKNCSFVWTDSCQNAFETIKQLLTSAPILSYPLLQGQLFLVDCDASNVGVGAVLSQIQDGEEKVISYFSKCLSRSERQYCTTRKELLAVVIAVKHFHHYLLGQRFTIRTDHGSLQWLMRFKNCEGQIARWIETLSAYTFTVVHRAGRVHNNADTMSRRPCLDNHCKYCDRYEQRYSPETMNDINKFADETCAVKRIASKEEKLRSDNEVTLPCIRSDNDITLPSDGTVQEHTHCVSYNCQDKDPEDDGPFINDDNISGGRALPTTCLGPGAAEVLSTEMTHGMSQIGVPHFTHATLKTVCAGVDAEAHKIIDSRHVHCCCCGMTACCTGDWWDHFEDETLFGCLFEIEVPSELLHVAHAGVATKGMTCGDKPWCPCKCKSMMVNTNTSNSDSLQYDQECEHSTSDRKLCLNTSQQSSGSGQSTSSCAETQNCLDITMENIRNHQENDSTLKLMLQWKRSVKKPSWSTVAPYCKELKAYWHEWDTIELKDNMLYKKRLRDIGNDAEYLFLVPEALRKEVFRQLHEYVTAGHLGRRKTYDKIRKRFYWCGMHKDVSYWCRICTTCGSRKMPHRHAKAPMRQYNVGYPMERIGLDICGPYPVSKKGNKYLMVVSCYFTKWVDAVPLKTQEAKYVATKLVNRFISIFGVPLQLHTDLGSNFESKVFQEVCKLLGIDKTRTTVRRPQSDGMVERANRSIQNMISSYISDSQDDWDENIPLLMMAYRSSIHESTGVSPAMMMFGRELTLPVDMTLGRPIREDSLCATDYAYQLERKLLDIHDFARKHLSISSESMKRRYDVKMNKVPYKVGDAVWYFFPKRKKGFNPKLQRPWKGPMIVIECLNEVLYKIQSSPKSKPMVVHHDKLKPYLGEDKPEWFVNKKS
ncbi:MAG: reverse transcriptase domain-containing protein [Candidatus Thiodiazotropha sp.]